MGFRELLGGWTCGDLSRMAHRERKLRHSLPFPPHLTLCVSLTSGSSRVVEAQVTTWVAAGIWSGEGGQSCGLSPYLWNLESDIFSRQIVAGLSWMVGGPASVRGLFGGVRKPPPPRHWRWPQCHWTSSGLRAGPGLAQSVPFECQATSRLLTCAGEISRTSQSKNERKFYSGREK